MTGKVSSDLLGDTLTDIYRVLKITDQDTHILAAKGLPVDFHEKEGGKVLDSYIAYIERGKLFKSTSIADRFRAKKYKSLYSLHHDIKISSASKIKNFKVGSQEYAEIDFFYRFSSEILAREASRLHLVVLGESDNDTEVSELETQLLEDYLLITHSYESHNGETITYTSKSPETPNSTASVPNSYGGYPQPLQLPQKSKQPLFSSFTKRSPVDPRLTIVPEPYSLSKVVPAPKNFAGSNYTLENLSPSVSKIPPPTSQPTEILSNFFHPNWYTIQVPTWLTYKSKVLKPPVTSSLLKSQREDDLYLVSRNDSCAASFAPIVDLKVSVVTEELKGNIWLNHLGFKEIASIKQRYLDSLTSKAEDDQSSIKDETHNDIEHENDTTEESKPMEKPEDKDIKSESASEYAPGSTPINIAHLAQWDPSKIEEFESIKQDKEYITKSPQELQKLISRNLLKLNKLRQERYLRSNPNNILSPSPTETRLYNKISKLITLSIELNNVNSGQLSIKFSNRLPVLMNEYSGTLPGAAPSKFATTGKSTRLPSIRGPYKKKNKQL